MNRSTLLLILWVFASNEAFLTGKLACTNDEILNIWYSECEEQLRETHTVDGKDTRTYCRIILDLLQCGYKLYTEKCGVETALKTLNLTIHHDKNQPMHKHNPKLWECKELEGFLRRIESESTSTTTPEPTTTTTAATTNPSHASNMNFFPALIIWVGIGSNYSE